jgi:hypothetical protein
MTQYIHVMAPFSQPWVPVYHQETGLHIEFPHQPLEITIEHTTSKDFPSGRLNCYSIPTKVGLFVLSTFTESSVSHEWLSEKTFHRFLEKIIVPYLFYTPRTFQADQVFTYLPLVNASSIEFQITYNDHGTVEKLQGVALVVGNTLCTYFYLSPEKNFDQEIFKRFLTSAYIEAK